MDTVEVLARAWIECDPNRYPANPDEPMPEMSGDLHNAPRWKWFVPRAEALVEYLAERGLEVAARD